MPLKVLELTVTLFAFNALINADLVVYVVHLYFALIIDTFLQLLY